MQPTEKSSADSNPNLIGTISKPVFTAPTTGPRSETGATQSNREPALPIEKYAENMGRPYLVDVMQIHGLHDNKMWSEKVKLIDGYILDKVLDGGLEHTKQAYESVLKKLEAELQIDPLIEFDKRIERLSGYIEVMREQKRIDRLKEQLGLNGNTI